MLLTYAWSTATHQHGHALGEWVHIPPEEEEYVHKGYLNRCRACGATVRVEIDVPRTTGDALTLQCPFAEKEEEV